VSIEEMKAELLAAGYEMSFTDFHVRYTSYILAPDGWKLEPSVGIAIEDMYNVSQEEIQDMIPRAYAHLVEKRELETLRAFVQELADLGAVYEAGSIHSVFQMRLAQAIQKAKTLTGKE
jgi:hypothetical protein